MAFICPMCSAILRDGGEPCQACYPGTTWPKGCLDCGSTEGLRGGYCRPCRDFADEMYRKSRPLDPSTPMEEIEIPF